MQGPTRENWRTVFILRFEALTCRRAKGVSNPGCRFHASWSLRSQCGTCYFAPKICSSLPLWLGFTEQRLIALRRTLARPRADPRVGYVRPLVAAQGVPRAH